MPTKNELDSKIQSEELFSAYDIAKALLKYKFDLDVLYKLGLICSRIGRIPEAQDCLSEYISQGGREPFASLNLGHMLKAQQKFGQAAKEYKAFISNNPNHAGHGWWHLSDLKDFKLDSAELGALETRKTELHNDNPDKMLMGFALAAFYERQQEFNKAFHSLRDANDMRRSLRPFNRDAFYKLVSNLDQLNNIACFEFEASFVPIFIVGMPRSGSTLHEQILCSHSQVQATDELPFINAFATGMERTGSYAAAISSLDFSAAAKLREQYYASTAPYREEGKRYFIDKSPINFIHIGLIKTIFPEAIIINTYRNTFANAMSVYKRYFFMGNEYAYHLDDIADYMSGYVRLMNVWQRLLPEGIIHCQYESLINDPERKIKALIAACGLPFEDACLRYYQNKRSVLTPSVDQVSKPIYKSAVDSWAVYDEFFSAQQKAKFKILNQQYELYFNGQNVADKKAAWSKYWAQGNRTLFTGQNIYDGAIKSYWASVAASFKGPLRVLDLCTGNGALPILLAEANTRKDVNFVGVDFASIASALNDVPANLPIEFIGNTSIEDLPFESQSFDVLVSQFGVEYVDLNVCIPEAARVLKEGGVFQVVCHVAESRILEENTAIFDCSKLVIARARPYLGEILKGLDLSVHSERDYTSVTEYCREKFNQEMSELAKHFGDTLFLTGFPDTLKFLLSQKGTGNAFAYFCEYLNSLNVAQERLQHLFDAALTNDRFSLLVSLLESNGFELQQNELLKQNDFVVGKIIKAKKGQKSALL